MRVSPVFEQFLFAMVIPGVYRYGVYGAPQDAAYLSVIIAAYTYFYYLNQKPEVTTVPDQIKKDIDELRSKLSNISLSIGIKAFEKKN
jgi:hypothetical protein